MVIGNIYYSVKARMCLTVVEVLFLDSDIVQSGRRKNRKPSEITLRFDNGMIHKTSYDKIKEGVDEKRLLYRGQDQSKTAITITSKGDIITLIQE